MERYRDRKQAGEHLARALAHLKGSRDLIVLAMPRGGVPVAAEVARALAAPLDVILVRKLGVPGHEELAMGAIATGGVLIRNESLIERLGVPAHLFEAIKIREEKEIKRREAIYRRGKPPLVVQGNAVILVDDGLATGATMLAAIRALRHLQARSILGAVPVAAPDTCDYLRTHADTMLCLYTPEPFFGVGNWYEDFAQTSDEEVLQLLEEADHSQAFMAKGAG